MSNNYSHSIAVKEINKQLKILNEKVKRLELLNLKLLNQLNDQKECTEEHIKRISGPTEIY